MFDRKRHKMTQHDTKINTFSLLFILASLNRYFWTLITPHHNLSPSYTSPTSFLVIKHVLVMNGNEFSLNMINSLFSIMVWIFVNRCRRWVLCLFVSWIYYRGNCVFLRGWWHKKWVRIIWKKTITKGDNERKIIRVEMQLFWQACTAESMDGKWRDLFVDL